MRRGAFALGALAFLAACGGERAVATRAPSTTSAAATAGPTTTGPTTTGPTTTTRVIDPADEERAAAVALSAGDLPGWTATPAPATGDPFADAAPRCAHLRRLGDIGTTSAQVTSPVFTAPDGLGRITNELRVYTAGEDAQRALAEFDQPATVRCLETIVTEFGAGVFVSDATARRRLLDAGDGGVSHLVSIAVEQAGERHLFAAELATVRVGRVLTTQLAFGYETVPSEAAPAIDAVIRRIEAAFG
jgi:hypothetical protein